MSATPRLQRVTLLLDEKAVEFLDRAMSVSEGDEVMVAFNWEEEPEGTYCWDCHGVFGEGECIPCDLCGLTFCPDCESNMCERGV